MQVCKKGSVLDPNQVAILRVFDIKMAKFKLKLLAVWEGERSLCAECTIQQCRAP
jgi:hypothetical protein